jgi:hypothetical protein
VILATWEVEIRRITIGGQPEKKNILKTPSQPMATFDGSACHSSCTGMHIKEDGNPGLAEHKAKPYLKNN